MAGESAEQVAQRHREKIQRLEESARRWERGAAGERVTGEVLDTLGPWWIVGNDLAWPGRPQANLDHVVIGPAGVFVVDSKAWSGSVVISRGVLRQNGRDRASQLAGIRDAAVAVASALGVPVHGIACLTQQTGVVEHVDGVAICSPDRLVTYLHGLPVVVPHERLASLAEAARGALPAATGARATPTGRPGRVSVLRPIAAPPRRTRRSARARQKAWDDLGRLLAGLALIGAMLIPAVREPIVGVFVDMMTPSTETDAPPPDGQPTEPAEREIGKKTPQKRSGTKADRHTPARS